MAGWRGCAGASKLGKSWAQPWGELRTHRRVGTWCSASRCLSPKCGYQGTQRRDAEETALLECPACGYVVDASHDSSCAHGSLCRYILWFSYVFPIRSSLMGWTMSLTFSGSFSTCQPGNANLSCLCINCFVKPLCSQC